MAAACGRIGATANRGEENEILVETLGGTLVSAGTGAVIGLVFASNPVGWGLALVLAAGTSATGMAAGWGAKEAYRVAYDRFGERVDFVAGGGIDRFCR